MNFLHVLKTMLLSEYADMVFFISDGSSFVIPVLSFSVVIFSVAFLRKLCFNHKIKPNGKAVLITGCDSGFGHELAKRLDSKGFHVFATCLFISNPGALELRRSCSPKLQILHLDVTQDESVKKAVENVKEDLGTTVMWAIVNNAGIAKGLSLEFSTIDDFKDCMNVNFLGMVRVTKEFLPLLKQAKGRIVNITSILGEMPAPFVAPYASSKYAAVGFTDCIRQELDMRGISVVFIEPELFRTGLTETVNNMAESMLKNARASLIREYGEDYVVSFNKLKDCFLSTGSDIISLLIDDLESAVTQVHPKFTYKPRINILRRFVYFCYEVMPRGCQFLIMKSILYLFSFKFKTTKNTNENISLNNKD